MNKGAQFGTESGGFFSLANIFALSLLILVLLAIRWSVIAPYFVPSGSMEPTIVPGDRLLALKAAYKVKIPFTDVVLFRSGKLRRGDVIVFRSPEDPEIDFIKRIVGLPGDRIRFVGGRLFINGIVQHRIDFSTKLADLLGEEPGAKDKLLYQEDLAGIQHWTLNGNSQSYGTDSVSSWPESEDHVVAEDSVFVVGDNRDNSRDSRDWGKVPTAYIHGKVLLVLWSKVPTNDRWWPRLRPQRFLQRVL